MNNTQIHKYTCTQIQTHKHSKHLRGRGHCRQAVWPVKDADTGTSLSRQISQTPWIHKYYKFMSTVGFRGCFIFKCPPFGLRIGYFCFIQIYILRLLSKALRSYSFFSQNTELKVIHMIPKLREIHFFQLWFE